MAAFNHNGSRARPRRLQPADAPVIEFVAAGFSLASAGLWVRLPAPRCPEGKADTTNDFAMSCSRAIQPRLFCQRPRRLRHRSRTCDASCRRLPPIVTRTISRGFVRSSSASNAARDETGDEAHGPATLLAGDARLGDAWRSLRVRAERPAVATAIPAGVLRGSNVLLVTIDTLRADHVGAYGSTLELTPTLDRFAREGARFAVTYAHVPLTLPSHTTIMTGLYPFANGVRDNGSFRFDGAHPTLAVTLKQAGYSTAAFVGAFVLDRRFGLNAGFDQYDDRMHGSGSNLEVVQRTAEQVLAPAYEWITSGGLGLGARGSTSSPRAETNARPEPVEGRAAASPPAPGPEPLVRVGPPLRSPRAVHAARALRVTVRRGSVRRRSGVRRRRAGHVFRAPARRRRARSHAGRHHLRPWRIARRARRAHARAVRLRRDAARAARRVGAFGDPARPRLVTRQARRHHAHRPRSGWRRRPRAARRPQRASAHRRRPAGRRGGILFRGAEREPHAQLGAAQRHRPQRAEARRPAGSGALRPFVRSGRDPQSVCVAARSRARPRIASRPCERRRPRSGDAGADRRRR